MAAFTGGSAVASPLGKVERVFLARLTLAGAHKPPHDDGVAKSGSE